VRRPPQSVALGQGDSVNRINNRAKAEPSEILGIARIKDINGIIYQRDSQHSVKRSSCFEPSRFQVSFKRWPHLKFETAALATGFLPVEIYHIPSIRCTSRALKHRRVSKRAIKLDKNLISNDPFVVSSQKFSNKLLSFHVLWRILVGSVDKDIGV
jgi:hypothetical protein